MTGSNPVLTTARNHIKGNDDPTQVRSIQAVQARILPSIRPSPRQLKKEFSTIQAKMATTRNKQSYATQASSPASRIMVSDYDATPA